MGDTVTVAVNKHQHETTVRDTTAKRLLKAAGLESGGHRHIKPAPLRFSLTSQTLSIRGAKRVQVPTGSSC